MRSLPRNVVLSLGLAAALAAPGGSSLAVDVNAPGSLCEALSAEELNALSPLEFGEPAGLRWVGCSFTAAPDQQGPHGVFLNLFSNTTLEEIAQQSSDAAPVDVDGRPGLASVSKRDGTFLQVGVADEVLQIRVAIEESPEAAGMDATDFAIDIATVAVPNLEAAMAALEVTLAELEAAEADALPDPPEVEGVTWSVSTRTGADIEASGNEAEVARMAPLLEAAGAELGQLSILDGAPRDAETREGLGGYLMIRVAGVEEDTLKSASLDWLRQTSGLDEIDVEETTIGGKDATVVKAGPDQRITLYFDGDTFVLSALSEEQTAAAFEQLP